MSKRIAILGGGGMVGHKIAQAASERFDTTVTLRRDPESYGPFFSSLRSASVRGSIDVTDAGAVQELISTVRPHFVVNCVGIVKQLPESHDPILAIGINSLVPHQIAAVCNRLGARVIQISTDCVFSGKKGKYSENDIPDPPDLYGRSKLLGELDAPHLTLRTSLIGRELLPPMRGLLEWFLAQRGTVRGYRRAVFSGLPTLVLAEVVCNLIEKDVPIHGLYHVSSPAINKYDLLLRLKDAYDSKVVIEPDDDVVMDRSLDSTAFRRATGFNSPEWPELIARMTSDPTPYDDWRSVDRHSHA